MPRLSIVVPVYQVESCVAECLDSVLRQSSVDFEVVAVDDCSTDTSGAVVDGYGARDGRVRPVHLSANGGLGNARNVGLAASTGDYVLFLDGDDTLAPGALRAVADRLAATRDPDVLVYDHAQVRPPGEMVRAGLPDAVRDDAVCALSNRPELLLEVVWAAWNKAYRRDFVTERGFAFPTGCYEDIPWTCQTLMSAERIAVLDEVVVQYRKDRPGSILDRRSRAHLDIFTQFDRVFDFLAEHPEFAHWEESVLRSSARQLFTLVRPPRLIPGDALAEFRRLCVRHFEGRPGNGATLLSGLIRLLG